MNSNTKERLMKILIYIIVGFAAAYFWQKVKGN
jgi:uncharacterized membrane protein YuzA (DUF378 family)